MTQLDLAPLAPVDSAPLAVPVDTGAIEAGAFRAIVGGRRVLKLRTLSVNEATIYRTCPELYELGYVADGTGYESTGKNFSFTFGTHWHSGQEAWWIGRKAGWNEDECMSSAYRAFDHPKPDERGNVPPPLDAFDRARIRALFALYHMLYWNDGLTPTEVEYKFVAPLLSPKGGQSANWDGLDGRIDLLAKNRRGEDLVIEHKTTGLSIDDDSDYWDRVKFDMQISQYIEGATHAGFPVRGLVYDVARKPHAQLKANKPEAGESPDAFQARLFRALAEEPKKYMRRKLIVRTDSEMTAARRDTWATARQIAMSHRENLWPRHATSCSRYGHRCEFFNVCAGEEDVRTSPNFRPKTRPTEQGTTPKEIATV